MRGPLEPLQQNGADRSLRKGKQMKNLCAAMAAIAFGVGTLSLQTTWANDQTEVATVSIPLSALNIEEAVATVSVLQDPAASANSLLGFCESKMLQGIEVEGEDIQGLIKKLCGAMKQFSREVAPPTQGLSANTYLITVPLKQPQQYIRSVTWTAKSLDDAIAFIDLLKSGQLKGMKVLTSVPWAPGSSQPCTECPISDLIFRIEAMKDKRQLFE